MCKHYENVIARVLNYNPGPSSTYRHIRRPPARNRRHKRTPGRGTPRSPYSRSQRCTGLQLHVETEVLDTMHFT